MIVGEDMNKSYHLPTSGQIIGMLFEILQVSRPHHLQKEIQRYFRGEKISESAGKEILYLLVDILLEREILPPQPLIRFFDVVGD